MQRRRIIVAGIVQGVGFRPFVCGLASKSRLHGTVSNCGGDVVIEVEGEPIALDEFVEQLKCNPPPLARIRSVSCQPLPPCGGDGFRIEPSQERCEGPVGIAADVATCADCLAELFDPHDRRFRYPFINCTQCGPRLTIITGAPFDRERTTMAQFAMCAECRSEYEDAANRRFHAQATACPLCGPQLQLRSSEGDSANGDDALTAFVAAIRAGRIGALKGIGGYHLVCDARHEPAVHELRRRKHRDEKPLAMMVRDAAAAASLCEFDACEHRLLNSPQSPIVLLRRRVQADGVVAPSIAPRNVLLGIMLPYTALHHLLFEAIGDVPLVMTSGNRSDEPIAYEDHDATQRLADLADVFLTHDRPIRVRCDDSVTRVVRGAELPVRRSRGQAPQPIHLPISCSMPLLAVGGQLKATFALAHGQQAILSHHIGDLHYFEALDAFRREVALYQELFAIQPQCVAHDLHPDYASTHYAVGLGLPNVGVQHHHAHMAACMAEHRLNQPVIGVTFDGAGFGTDGAVWGGEFLVGDYSSFRRAAHLRYVGMPGGERSIREPWRMALTHLRDAGCDESLLRAAVSREALRTVNMMLDRRVHTPLTSSMGRLFDAIAALAGLRYHAGYEGQTAVELEWAAGHVQDDVVYPFDVSEYPGDRGAARTPDELPVMVLDTRPLVQAAADDIRNRGGAHLVARRFHNTIAAMVVQCCGRIHQQTGLSAVVLSGGVFANALLTHSVTEQLVPKGFSVYRHQAVPPNDGGLSLGQAAIAARRMQANSELETQQPCAWESPVGSLKPTGNTTC